MDNKRSDRRKLIRLWLSVLAVFAMVITTACAAAYSPPWWLNVLSNVGIAATILIGEWVV